MMTNKEVVERVGIENIITIAGMLGSYEESCEAVISSEDKFIEIVMGVAKDYAIACRDNATPLDSWAVFEKGIRDRINKRGD